MHILFGHTQACKVEGVEGALTSHVAPHNINYKHNPDANQVGFVDPYIFISLLLNACIFSYRST